MVCKPLRPFLKGHLLGGVWTCKTLPECGGGVTSIPTHPPCPLNIELSLSRTWSIPMLWRSIFSSQSYFVSLWWQLNKSPTPQKGRGQKWLSLCLLIGSNIKRPFVCDVRTQCHISRCTSFVPLHTVYKIESLTYGDCERLSEILPNRAADWRTTKLGTHLIFPHADNTRRARQETQAQ